MQSGLATQVLFPIEEKQMVLQKIAQFALGCFCCLSFGFTLGYDKEGRKCWVMSINYSHTLVK